MVEGERLLLILEGVATDGDDKPKLPVTIRDCGQLSTSSGSGSSDKQTNLSVAVAVADDDQSVPTGFSSRGSKKYQSAIPASVAAAGAGGAGAGYAGKATSSTISEAGTDSKKEDDKDNEAEKEEEEEEEEEEVDTSKMTPMQRRMFAIRMKMNAARRSNRDEVAGEFRRNTDPKGYEQSVRKEQARANKDEGAVGEGGVTNESDRDYHSKRLALKGLKQSDGCMLETVQSAQRVKAKAERKVVHEKTFGYAALARAGDFYSYEKGLSKLPASGEADSSGPTSLMDYGTVGTSSSSSSSSGNNSSNGNGVSKAGLDRLARDIEERDAKRFKQSSKRHRDSADAAGVDSINDKNEFFNKKLKRSFDKYTVEIRQNLERGTAI